MKITSFPTMEQVNEIALDYLGEDYEMGRLSALTEKFVSSDLTRITEELLVDSGLTEVFSEFNGYEEIKKFTEKFFEEDPRLGSSLLFTMNCLEDLELSKAPYACFTLALLSMADDADFYEAGSENIPENSLSLFERSVDLLWSFLGQLLVDKPKSRKEALNLCRVVDLLNLEIDVLTTLGIYSDNSSYLSNFDEWFAGVTEAAEKYLLPEDYEDLSKSTYGETLSAMHASNVDFAWLESVLSDGLTSVLANNEHIPSEVVNRLLKNSNFDRLTLVIHPNADPELAVSVILEILNNEEDIQLLRPWDNFVDDGFNNYNSFSNGKVYPKVIQAISDWCDEEPDGREAVRDFLDSYSDFTLRSST